jgi:hypothetical protein
MADQVDRDALEQKWVHSHEEDTSDETVFRPASYRFPPSRGRKAFQLDGDGKLVNFGIGADDRTVQSEGRWQLDDRNRLTLQAATPGMSPSVMQLLHVGRDKLVVKKQ